MIPTTRRFIQTLGICALALSAGGCAWLSDRRPEGVADASADQLARRMMESVDADAWKRTGAITWTFRGKYNHLWDRKRQLVRVRDDDWEVFVDLKSKQGIATEDGVALKGAAKNEAVQTAYAAWANDSFWLTAMNKAFDPGTRRYRVTQTDGREALFVAYSSGGVTPGDAYLWHLDENGRPVSWQMWVSVIPIDGVSATWDNWVQIRTGAWVSTRHSSGLISVEVTDLDGAESLDELVPGSDPFAALTRALAQ